MDEARSKARCANCRTDVEVPDSYSNGDHIKCGVCGTQHKVVRGDALKLVLADVEPVRQALRENERRISSLKDELQRARGSFGLGVEGLGAGIIYIVWQIALKEHPWTKSLLIEGIAVAIVSGVFLELANYLFLAKRSAITRLSAEIGQLQDEGRSLQQRIREASRK
jgi:DNA-directed RNA polymerase subunit RPC12/RpoP